MRQLVCVLLSIGGGLPASEFQQKVYAEIHSDDPGKTELQSYLNRELRALRNVQVVTAGEEDLAIEVVMVSLSGVNVASVVVSSIGLKELDVFTRAAIPRSATLKLLETQKVHYHGIMSSRGPERLATRIAVEVDVEVIEPIRQQYRKVMEMIESRQAPKPAPTSSDPNNPAVLPPPPVTPIRQR